MNPNKKRHFLAAADVEQARRKADAANAKARYIAARTAHDASTASEVPVDKKMTSTGDPETTAVGRGASAGSEGSTSVDGKTAGVATLRVVLLQ